ncbi:MAG: hypothetical protein PGN13_16270 [Patulibacter minatonensis]
MPWRGPEFPGEFPTLGWIVAEWIEANCVVPDRGSAGEPFRLRGWQLQHLLWQMRLHPDAEYDPDKPAAPFLYNGTLMVRPQKSGKGPFSAARICAQAAGPVLFGGWDEDGDPIGIPWASPHIQVAATAEDQTDNIWRVLKPMIELGPLANVITDTGLQRMNLPNGGIIEPVTSKALTRLGARITYVEIDQPESMTDANKGTKLVTTLLRNLSGTGGRFGATGNAHDPTEKSIQQTWVEKPRKDMWVDFPPPAKGNWKNKRDRRRIVTKGYEDSPWVDPERILAEAEAFDLAGNPNEAARFLGNIVTAGADKAFDLERYRSLAVERRIDGQIGIPKGRWVTLGFDGAVTKDTTGLLATDVETGHAVVVRAWARPLHLRDDEEWRIPIAEVNESMEWAYSGSGWKVWRGYFDPPHYRDDIARWISAYGDEKVHEWWTDRRKAMGYAIKDFVADLAASSSSAGPITHGPLDDSQEARALHEMLQVHVGNAVRKLTQIPDEDPETKTSRLWIISKESDDSVNKIDLGMCHILAQTARRDAIRSGVLNTKTYRTAGW